MKTTVVARLTAKHLLPVPICVQAQLFVDVTASVTQPELGDSSVSNTFSFVFEVQAKPAEAETPAVASTDSPPGTARPGRVLRQVIPTTVEDAMRKHRAFLAAAQA